MLIGWFRPVKTVLTVRLGSNIDGETAAACTRVLMVAELLLVSKSVSLAVTEAVLVI